MSTKTPKKKPSTAKKPPKRASNTSKKRSAPARKPQKKPAKKAHSKSSKSLIYKLFKWCFVCCLWGFSLLVIIVLFFLPGLPDIDLLNKPSDQPSIQIVAADGSYITTIGERRAEYLHFHDLPEILVEAILATEDRRFFDHSGIDVFGITRAMVKNIQAGRLREGGSTITQQLAKITFLSSERSLKRKVQEAVLALWLEASYSKEQLFTMYVNRVYLGAGNYGVDAAARSYFGKSAREVDMVEAALIAGLLKAPSRYSPFTNPDLSAKRAYQVLINMSDAGFLPDLPAEQEVRQVAYSTLDKPATSSALGGHYFVDWMMGQLPHIKNVSKALQPITIYTTLDSELQKKAERSLQNMIKNNQSTKRVNQSALVSIAHDGAVKAMVGGTSYKKSQYNRVTQSKRQPGSLFKLFVYLAAFEKGWSPDTRIFDQPTRIGDWKPANYKQRYIGETYLLEAFAKSSNSVAVQLLQDVGIGAILRQAKRLGIQSHLNEQPSLVLGTSEVTLLEMTNSFNMVANGGYIEAPYGVTQIIDRDGNVIYSHEADTKRRVISPAITRNMQQLLHEVMVSGTGKQANISTPSTHIGGKTGTTQSYRDAWFIGYHDTLTTGIWMGNDDNSSMNDVTGGSLPATLWREVMR